MSWGSIHPFTPTKIEIYFEPTFYVIGNYEDGYGFGEWTDNLTSSVLTLTDFTSGLSGNTNFVDFGSEGTNGVTVSNLNIPVSDNYDIFQDYMRLWHIIWMRIDMYSNQGSIERLDWSTRTKICIGLGASTPTQLGLGSGPP